MDAALSPLSTPSALAPHGMPATHPHSIRQHAGPPIHPANAPDARIRPHASQQTLGRQLKFSLRSGDAPTALNALNAGAKPDRRLRNRMGEQGRSAMQRAVEERVAPDLLQMLIDHGGSVSRVVGGPKLMGLDVNRNERGDTLLHRAVRFDNPQAVRVLLAAGAVQSLNKRGQHPYALAWERYVAAPHDPARLEMVTLLTPLDDLARLMNWKPGFVPDPVLRALVPRLSPEQVAGMNAASVVSALPFMTAHQHLAITSEQLNTMTDAQRGRVVLAQLAPQQLRRVWPQFIATLNPAGLADMPPERLNDLLNVLDAQQMGALFRFAGAMAPWQVEWLRQSMPPPAWPV